MQIADNGSDMKKTCLAISLFLLTFLPAYAQQNGVLEGKVVNQTDPSIIARNVDLEVLELGGGMSIIRSAKTDASGKFHITGLPQDRRLMVRANYKGANYHASAEFVGGKATVELAVYEPTTSMKDIQFDDVTIAFQLIGDRLKVLETVTVNNRTNPAKTFASPEGNFRISKPAGILEPPKLRVTAPGSSMPLVQSALESADGKSYYSLYPLRPGITKFEIQQFLPYKSRTYTFTKTFYADVKSLNIGVIPQDMAMSGKGLTKLQTDTARNFSVYASAPVKPGGEIVWEFSGGTPVPEATETESASTSGGGEVTAVPNVIGRNAMIIGPLMLMGFILVLWYGYNRSQAGSEATSDFRFRKIKENKEQLLARIATLDLQYEGGGIGEQEYQKQREESKRRLRRISLLLKK